MSTGQIVTQAMNVNHVLSAIPAVAGRVDASSPAHAVQEESGSSNFWEDDMPLPELVDASSTLSERLEACECFMVRSDDLGLVWECMAETIRVALNADRWPLAAQLLPILEREIQREIFHDYLNGEYREEISRRVAVLRLAREH